MHLNTHAQTPMILGPLNHYTIRCRPDDLAILREFYVDLMGLVEGDRPLFSFPGHWLYANGRPIVHLAGTLEDRPQAQTGPIDHIAFTGTDSSAVRRQLTGHGINFEERPVPGFPLHQFFLSDPLGLKIEVTCER